MAAQHEDIGAEAIALGYIIVNLIAHNINDVLHFITFGLTTGYLLWRWRRDWRKDKAERNGKN